MFMYVYILRYCRDGSYEVGSAHRLTPIEISTKLQQHCHYLSVASE